MNLADSATQVHPHLLTVNPGKGETTMFLNPQIFEMVMLICFGSSWPLAIMKTVRSKCVRGKSLQFLCCIFIGYLAGIAYKLTSNFDHVIWLYCVNALMIAIEILLYFRYSRPSRPEFESSMQMSTGQASL